MTYNVDISVWKLIHLFFGNIVEDIINIEVKLDGKLMGGNNNLTTIWTNYII
jgi:hypothetical protein